MKPVLFACLSAIALTGASAGDRAGHDGGQAAARQTRRGCLPRPEIERRIIALMPGAEYLDVDGCNSSILRRTG